MKTKVNAIAAAAALTAMLGLGACGGQAASSATSSTSESTSAATSTTSEATSTSEAASSTATSATSSTAAEDTHVSWQGALADGTMVDYISSNDGTHGGFVLTKADNSEPKRWLGAMTVTEDGKVTITDDTSKESISFTLAGVTEDGVVVIDVDGYGKGALVSLTAADWKMIAEAEEYVKTMGTTIGLIGFLDDGTFMAYMENQDGSEAAVAILPKGATEMKTWQGKATTDDSGKETVTDSKTGEAFSYTWTKNAEDGTVSINSDQYGKGTLVEMTVGDWVMLEAAAAELGV